MEYAYSLTKKEISTIGEEAYDYRTCFRLQIREEMLSTIGGFDLVIIGTIHQFKSQEARVGKNRWKQYCIFSMKSQRQRVILMIWQKSQRCEFVLSENESTDCLRNSIRKLKGSKDPADIWTYEHALNVSGNGILFLWVHEGEWDVYTFRYTPLDFFQI